MRMPTEGEDLVGKICICSIGRIAIVTGKRTFDWGESWCGISFDGKGTWASSEPVIAYDSADEYRFVLDSRFNGKMSFNS